MEVINARYKELCSTPSDINEHLPVLRGYAARSSTVAEFGVRGIVSTWALLKGLAEGLLSNDEKRLVCVDVEAIPGIDEVAELAATVGVELQFLQGDSAKLSLPFDVDLLFIDTWHVYGHLKRELAAHCFKARRFIIMHDTTVDAEEGETLRMGWDPAAQAEDSGYPIEEITRGLWPAVEEFLAEHREWELAERYTNNNGMTILRRK
ncbi:hypothetical protein N2152v2_006439 [Parachlorella kessleri]